MLPLVLPCSQSCLFLARGLSLVLIWHTIAKSRWRTLFTGAIFVFALVSFGVVSITHQLLIDAVRPSAGRFDSCGCRLSPVITAMRKIANAIRFHGGKRKGPVLPFVPGACVFALTLRPAAGFIASSTVVLVYRLC